MIRKVRDVMTPAPTGMAPVESVVEAARIMRDAGIGTVLVLDAGRVRGIVTDRDIVIRVVAEGRNPQTTRVGDICSTDLVVVGPDDDVTEATRLMREHAVRRVPVIENRTPGDGTQGDGTPQDGTPVGLVSIGDLALWLDDGSALADVAAAPPNT